MRRLLLVLPILVLTLVGYGFYMLRTVDVDAPEGVVDLVYPQGVEDNGLLTMSYYMKYDLLPTEKTKADVVYRVIVDSRLLRREDKIIWSPLEIGIGKAKSIKRKLSHDEFVALGQHPQYEMTVSEVRSEKYGMYLMLPALYIGILALVVMAGFGLLGNPLKRRTDLRPFRNYRVEAKAAEMTDEELARRCLECSSIKMTNGVLRCSREVCKY